MFPPGTRGRARGLPYTMDAFMLGMGMLSELHANLKPHIRSSTAQAELLEAPSSNSYYIVILGATIPRLRNLQTCQTHTVQASISTCYQNNLSKLLSRKPH